MARKKTAAARSSLDGEATLADVVVLVEAGLASAAGDERTADRYLSGIGRRSSTAP